MTTKQDYIKEKIKQHYKDKTKNEKMRDYFRDKYVSDKVDKYYADKKHEYIKNIIIDRSKGTINKIYDNLRWRLFKTIKDKNLPYFVNHIDIIGCSEKELEVYLEEKFKENMTYENYGEWHVDHIYPISKFDLNNLDNFKKCFHYTNLQPLWAEENYKKYNKIITIEN